MAEEVLRWPNHDSVTCLLVITLIQAYNEKEQMGHINTHTHTQFQEKRTLASLVFQGNLHWMRDCYCKTIITKTNKQRQRTGLH